MNQIGIVGIALIMINIVVSFFGFKNKSLLESYCFQVDQIIQKKQFIRLFTSGFFHVNWMHLIFNMFSLYFFSNFLELEIGHWLFLFIYLTSLISGNLLALFIHRNNGNYSAIGASGAVSGIIFSSIALFPDQNILIFFIPMPSWIFGLLYTLVTIYGIRSQKTNIGHEAHLGGALAGIILTLIFNPTVVEKNYIPILAITIPAVIFILFTAIKPRGLMFNFSSKKLPNAYTIDDQYNEDRVKKAKEVDRILEKIHKTGLNSLTKKEKSILEEYSKK